MSAMRQPAHPRAAPDFKAIARGRMERGADFRNASLVEAVMARLASDFDTGNAMLRDCINATVGFENLGLATKASPNSLMRMFGPRGNPRVRNLFAVVGELQRQARVKLEVRAA